MIGYLTKFPKSWKVHELEALSERIVDCPHSTPKWADKGIICLRTSNLTEGGWNWDDTRYVTEEDYKIRTSRSEIIPGDIILSREGTVGIAATVPDGLQVCMGQRLVQVRPKHEVIDSSFLLRVLLWQLAPTRINQLMRGSTSQHLNVKDLRSMTVPLPPIEEQRRIAAILDRADAVRRKRQAAIALTDELLRSAFLEMFGDPVTNPKEWQVVKIGDITTVKTGKTPSRDEPDNYGGSVRWVKTTEVKDTTIEDTEEHLTEKGASQMNVFPINSILVAMYGQGATRGRTALLNQPCTTNQACAVILPSTQFRPNYIWTLLKLSYNRLRELGRGGNQPNLNLDMIKQFEVPLPPVEKQQKLDLVQSQLLTQSRNFERSYQLQDELFNSLLQRAFQGEL